MQKFTLDLKTRPWWLTLIWIFCLYMTFIYMPFDMFTKPFENWEEVWFGYKLTGWPAKLTEPLHWLIYAAGSVGIWKMKTWMWPWAAVYSAQISVGMLLFGYFEGDTDRGVIGAAIALLFLVPTVALWRAKPQFTN